MEIRKSTNLFSLFIESFGVVNRIGVSVLVLFVVWMIANFLCSFLAPFIPSNIARVGLNLINIVVSSFFSIALVRIIAARAENVNDTVSECLTSSIIPTAYMLVLQICVGVILFIIGLVLSLVPSLGIVFVIGVVRYKVLLLLALAILAFIAVRFAYVGLAIAVRAQGPVGAVLYSWNLSRGHFFYILGALIIGILFPLLFSAAIGYGVYTIIPLYFANSFDITNLSPVWYGVFGVLILSVIFSVLAMAVYYVLVFLSLDYAENRGSALIMPPDPIEDEENAVDNEQFQTFTNTVSLEADSAQKQNLQKVYQPKEKLNIEDSDEDRMPTLLFDESMAKEIEQNAQFWQQESAKKKETQATDGSPVKVSKDDLQL